MDETHHEIRSFAHHTKSKAEDVLMASFVDSHGGSDTTGATGTGVPLVHYISLDHESKAVVLACRGTLGFEDVLADLACDYDDMSWRGKSYQVHKGVHASARRLLYGGDGRVLYTLKEALDEFSDFGLILCGHSLGGAVTALLGTMLAEPSPTGTGFVTSAEPHHRLLTYESLATAGSGGTTPVCLPSGRPIHVYAYGPPGTMSPALRKATRGLITSIVHGHDLVPYLSLGVLHDFQAVALAFQSDSTDASRIEARRRVWQAFQHGLADKWYATSTASLPENDQWALTALGSLRRSIVGTKLVPPGEVFVVESSKVLRRDAFVLAEEVDIGQPAKRVVLKYIRDVEARFGEVRFGTSMLMDHSPAKYEEALRKLRLGVVDAGY
ncbi:Sn1-specific diacylglycerol lipase alpha like protein [Verticillium longisporum]|nr:Sn1-specific diacylglycerol lipase alpha like protein [Verticillium longisporum]